MSKTIGSKTICILLAVWQFLGIGAPVKGQEEAPKEEKKINLEPKYRIISGRNYEINLNENSNFIYLIPVNYKVNQETGLGKPSKENQLQPNEVPEGLILRHVGMSIIGLARNIEELYLSFFFQGYLPSRCHSVKIETEKVEEKETITINTLIFAGINRRKICVTQANPVEGTFIGEALVRNRPILLQVNYQDFAKILWQDDELQIVHNNMLWKITKLNKILNYEPVSKQEQKSWINGKPMEPQK